MTSSSEQEKNLANVKCVIARKFGEHDNMSTRRLQQVLGPQLTTEFLTDLANQSKELITRTKETYKVRDACPGNCRTALSVSSARSRTSIIELVLHQVLGKIALSLDFSRGLLLLIVLKKEKKKVEKKTDKAMTKHETRFNLTDSSSASNFSQPFLGLVRYEKGRIVSFMEWNEPY
eukprot:g4262.t1